MMRNKKLHYQIVVAPPLDAPSLSDSLASITVS
jgi:hypothetical protein